MRKAVGTLLYVDRIIASDTSYAAFNALKSKGYEIMRPSQAILIADHYTPSSGRTFADVVDDERRRLIRNTEEAGRRLGMTVFGLGDPRGGIQHVVSAEQAYAQPGLTVVASDSHTTTQGALGALAFSVSTDLAHVLATQCVWLKIPTMTRITLDGELAPGVTAKDVAMAVVAKVGSAGAAGSAVEYAGSFVRRLSMEGRMTVCNMSVEMGARLGVIAPDEVTFDYLRGRPFAPSPRHWAAAVTAWREFFTDPDATFDRELTIDVSALEPMVSWGNNTEDALSISGHVPDPAQEMDDQRRAQMTKSLDYMGLEPGTPMTDISIDQVFIGSCTNARIEDLRSAARVLRGREVVVPTLVVPGSGMVKAQAEAEGLDAVFRSAGATWGEAGCSMCSSMNGDLVAPKARCASTSNRNHMGRQGVGSRTHLLSPIMAAAAAVEGHLVDVRALGII